MDKLNLLSDLVINELFMQGFYVGLFVTFAVGMLAYGINYALKLFNTN